MNDLAKPDLKHGVPLSCIPEVGHRRRMQRKLKFQSTAVCAVVIMIATCRGLALDPSQPASSYLSARISPLKTGFLPTKCMPFDKPRMDSFGSGLKLD